MADKIEDQGERPSSLKENSLPFQESLWSEVELSYDRKVRTHLASWKFNAAITYTNIWCPTELFGCAIAKTRR